MAVFDSARVKLVDTVKTTAIWRGNIPLNVDGKFAYGEIADSLRLSPTTALIDISLIDNVEGSERSVWLQELAGYSVDGATAFPGGANIPPQFNEPDWNPAKFWGEGVRLPGRTMPGHLVWWPIEGGATPDVLGPDLRSYNFAGLIEYFGVLRTMRASAIYFHCMNGTDRTGAVVAGYAIRWMGKTLKEALTLADSLPAAGRMSGVYRDLVGAYWAWPARPKAR